MSNTGTNNRTEDFLPSADGSRDPHAWLEDINGEAALEWVREHNERAEATLDERDLTAQLEREILEILDAKDKIPSVATRGDYLYNFWTDAEHERGLWRRTTLEQYRSESPEWDVLIDVDALNEAEGEDWVWHGATALRPAQGEPYRRFLISLSHGGSDADVTREWDLRTRSFVPESEGGFFRPEAKGSMSWISEDTAWVSTDFGEGTLTTSGYPRQARLWRRGQALADAELVFEVASDDMAVYVGHDSTPGYERDYLTVHHTFYTSSRYLVTGASGAGADGAGGAESADGGEAAGSAGGAGGEIALHKVNVPADMQVGASRDLIVFEPRSDWEVGGTTYSTGSLVVADHDRFFTGNAELTALFTPTASASLQGVTITKNYLVLTIMEDVRHRLEVHYRDEQGTWVKEDLYLHLRGAIGVGAVDPVENDRLWITLTDFVTPTTLLLGDLGGLRTGGSPSELETIKTTPHRYDAEGVQVTQHFVVSDDGTRIPYFEIAKASAEASASNAAVGASTVAAGASNAAVGASNAATSASTVATSASNAAVGASTVATSASNAAVGAEASGPRPTLLYGYGGFEVSMTPAYLGAIGKAWVERGGVYVVANIRGGGEYGPAWHQAGLKEHRHRVYEDFSSVARDLIERGVTDAKHLGVRGGSNGGLLTGNMLTQYPGLFGAVIIQVPLLDMKRYSHLLAGASWMAEYGDPDTEEWEFIKTFSPYHLLTPSATYPPTFVLTSTRDDRVHPGHARKFTAALEGLGAPVTYWENTEGGHGGAASNKQAARMNALMYSFLWRELEQ